MRIITPRPLAKLDPTAALGACVDKEHLMHIIAGQAIWGGDQEACKGRHGGPIPETIETGPVECGPAIAIIPIDVRIGDMPLGMRGHVIAESTQLLVNR